MQNLVNIPVLKLRQSVLDLAIGFLGASSKRRLKKEKAPVGLLDSQLAGPLYFCEERVEEI